MSTLKERGALFAEMYIAKSGIKRDSILSSYAKNFIRQACEAAYIASREEVKVIVVQIEEGTHAVTVRSI